MKKFMLICGSLCACFNLNAQQNTVAFQKPPFVSACEGKTAGAECSFTSRDGKSVSDKCQSAKNPKGVDELVCGLPKKGQGGTFVKPPFVSACEGKTAGAECSFTSRDGKNVSNKCQNSKNPKGEDVLVCGVPPVK